MSLQRHQVVLGAGELLALELLDALEGPGDVFAVASACHQQDVRAGHYHHVVTVQAVAPGVRALLHGHLEPGRCAAV